MTVPDERADTGQARELDGAVGDPRLPRVLALAQGEPDPHPEDGHISWPAMGAVLAAEVVELRRSLARLPGDTVQAPDVAAQIPIPLVQALDHFRWCWDCGSDVIDCDKAREDGSKCCPDCRHRDSNAVYLAELLSGRAMRRDHPNAVRSRQWDPTILQRHQLIDWAARLARLSWSGDEQAHAAAQSIARELKSAADSSSRALLGTDTTPD